MPSHAPTSSVECPAGQTFDGKYRQPALGASIAEPVDSEPSDAGTGEGSGASTEGTQQEPAQEPAQEPEQEPASAGSGDEGQDGAGLATAVDVSMASQAGPLIQYMASAHLPSGARPFGTPFAAQFTEGQKLVQNVKLKAGRCYTVVTAGLPPITEVDVEFRSVGSAASDEPLAKDKTHGPQAVLGSRSECFRAVDQDVTLMVRVVSGQGVVAGQVFEKP